MEKGGEAEVPVRRKRSTPSKYNKLTKEQKIILIKEWERTHFSYASIAEKYSTLWGISLSRRGIGDLVKHWRENGKIRGYSNDNTVEKELLTNLKLVCKVCKENRYAIRETELYQIQKWIMQVSGQNDSDVPIYPFHNTIKLHVSQVASALQVSIPSSNLNSIMALTTEFPASSIFCIDSYFFLPNTSVSTNLSTEPSPCVPFIVWNAFSLDGTFLYHFTQQNSLPALLQLLDNSVSRVTCVLMHSIEPIFESITTEMGYQKVTFCHPSILSSLSSSIHFMESAGPTKPVKSSGSSGSTRHKGSTNSSSATNASAFSKSQKHQQSFSPLTLSLQYIRIHEMSREDAFAVLPSYRGLSQLFRLCIKCV